jgi:hypothetical protein
MAAESPARSGAGLPGIALAAAAVLMLAYRFADLDLAPFLQDEPLILALARRQLQTGRWLTHMEGIHGTQGVFYGPTALWFYSAVQALFGPDPLTAVRAHALALTAGHLLLAAGLARLFGGGPALFAMILALVASSPYQFYWSRTAWDLLVNPLAAAAVLVLAAAPRPGWRRPLLAGVLLGAAVSDHLMAAPLAVLAVLLIAGGRPAPEARGPRAAAVALAAILAVNVPYLTYLAGSPSAPSLHRGGFSLLGWLDHVVGPARVASAWGTSYFFEAGWADFAAWLGAAAPLLGGASAGMAFCLVLAVLGIAAALRSPDAAPRRIALLAAAAWIVYPTFYELRGLDPHPHYHAATWWIVPVGAAAALRALEGRSRRLGIAAGAAIWLLAALQFAFIVTWVEFTRARDGIQGGFGTPLGSQIRAVREACSSGGGAIVLQNETRILNPALSYIAGVDPACSGREPVVCRPGRCPPPAPGERRLRLVYAGRTGGAVRLVDG